MRIDLDIRLYTDGDFSFGDVSKLIDRESPEYDSIYVGYAAVNEDYYILIRSVISGNDDEVCLKALENIFDNISNNLRAKDYVKKYIEDIIDPIRNHIVYCKGNMEYNNVLSGNYEGNIHISINNNKSPCEYEWDVTEEMLKELEENVVLKGHREISKTLEIQAHEIFSQGEGNGR